MKKVPGTFFYTSHMCNLSLQTVRLVTQPTTQTVSNTMVSRNWCFTINNPTDEDDPMQWDCQYVVWQKEQTETGPPHYQGYVEFDTTKRLAAVKKINTRAHWEKRKAKTAKLAIDYCKKLESRIDGPWENGEKKQQGQRSDLEAACETAALRGYKATMLEHPTEFAKYNKGLSIIAKESHHARMAAAEKDEMKDVVLYEWQQRLMDKLSGPIDPRKIMWYWETKGNVGKTFMAKYMLATKDATVLDCSKKNDLTYMLRDHEGDTVLFNIVRSIDEQYMGHVYGLAEAIKDNFVISTKYETCRIPLGKQHVVVFANIPPDMSKWSKDRYDIHEIDMSSPWKPLANGSGASTASQSKKRKRSDADSNPTQSKRPVIEMPTPTLTKRMHAKCKHGKCADNMPCFCAQNAYVAAKDAAIMDTGI